MLTSSQNTKELDSYYQATSFSTTLDTMLANQAFCIQSHFLLYLYEVNPLSSRGAASHPHLGIAAIFFSSPDARFFC